MAVMLVVGVGEGVRDRAGATGSLYTSCSKGKERSRGRTCVCVGRRPDPEDEQMWKSGCAMHVHTLTRPRVAQSREARLLGVPDGVEQKDGGLHYAACNIAQRVRIPPDACFYGFWRGAGDERARRP